MDVKRIFVGLPVSIRLQEEISEWEKGYKDLPVRWMVGKNLHITLVPPWYTDDVEAVAEKLSGIKGRPFDIEFHKVAYGPDSKRPRLIWAEGKAPKELAYLKARAERALKKEAERRPFSLHLTLARFRPEDFPRFRIKELNEKVSWRDKASSIVLMESRLSHQGANYEVLEEFRFTND